MQLQISIVRCAALTVAVAAAAAPAGLPLGCDTTQDMHSAVGVPASQGTVNATAGANGNTKVAVHVKHLALPSKMASNATVYVVWIQARNAVEQNVGALILNGSLEGRLDTVTPHSRFRVTVTPESNGQVARSTNEPVFSADVDRTK